MKLELDAVERTIINKHDPAAYGRAIIEMSSVNAQAQLTRVGTKAMMSIYTVTGGHTSHGAESRDVCGDHPTIVAHKVVG